MFCVLVFSGSSFVIWKRFPLPEKKTNKFLFNISHKIRNNINKRIIYHHLMYSWLHENPNCEHYSTLFDTIRKSAVNYKAIFNIHYCQAIRKKFSEFGLRSLLFSNPEARFFQYRVRNFLQNIWKKWKSIFFSILLGVRFGYKKRKSSSNYFSIMKFRFTSDFS